MRAKIYPHEKKLAETKVSIPGLVAVILAFAIFISSFCIGSWIATMGNITLVEGMDIEEGKQRRDKFDEGWVNNLESIFFPQFQSNTQLYQVWNPEKYEQDPINVRDTVKFNLWLSTI